METAAYAYFLTFLTALLGIWKAVPVGFAFGLNPVATYLLTVLGATTAAFILYYFGHKIRKYILRQKPGTGKDKKQTRALRLFEKYGAAGLGFFGCLVLGPNLTILIGLLIVRRPGKLLSWTIAGILVWSLALSLLAVLSIDLFHQLTAS